MGSNFSSTPQTFEIRFDFLGHCPTSIQVFILTRVSCKLNLPSIVLWCWSGNICFFRLEHSEQRKVVLIIFFKWWCRLHHSRGFLSQRPDLVIFGWRTRQWTANFLFCAPRVLRSFCTILCTGITRCSARNEFGGFIMASSISSLLLGLAALCLMYTGSCSSSSSTSMSTSSGYAPVVLWPRKSESARRK